MAITRSRVGTLLGRTNTQAANIANKTNSLYGYNPYLKSDGTLVNPYLNYQSLLDNPNVSEQAKNFITDATGKTQTPVVSAYDYAGDDEAITIPSADIDVNNIAKLDVTKELPKLTSNQISSIISKYFTKSTVIKPSDAKGIYNAQQKSGMSALAILGIGALESGYGTSNIAKKKNNLWGWNATNKNPAGNAKAFSPVSQGALEFANSFLKTYYNKYGAKSIYAAGTGNNPAGKGYAYYDNGTINSSWATNVGSIMQKFYNTAYSSQPTKSKTALPQPNGKYKAGQKVADVSKYNNSAAIGQCVWYARGRAQEKLGKSIPSLGNGNQIYANAKKSAKLSATKDNIKPNIIVSYNKGTSKAGQTAGHAIYIEDVVGDTVYYTEGGSAYYKNGTIGTVKTATKQGILDGINSNGNRMGSGVLGFVDVTKY